MLVGLSTKGRGSTMLTVVSTVVSHLWNKGSLFVKFARCHYGKYFGLPLQFKNMLSLIEVIRLPIGVHVCVNVECEYAL